MAKLENLPTITKSNYFSPEISKAYWSVSQVKSFLSCEARAMAELNGEYERPASDDLLLGSYVSAYFHGKAYFASFCHSHPGIIFNSRSGELKASFKQALEAIKRAKEDPVFLEYLTPYKNGRQKIAVGYLFGQFPFRIKMDVWNKGVRITDLKYVKDFQPMYKPGEGRMSFIEYWGYVLQGAVYTAIEGNSLPFYIAAISKEEPADILLVEVDRERMDAELAALKEEMPRLDAVKRGILEPRRCGCCEYCRRTHKIIKPITIDDLYKHSVSSFDFQRVRNDYNFVLRLDRERRKENRDDY